MGGGGGGGYVEAEVVYMEIKWETKGESAQDSGETSADIWARYLDREENTG